MEWWLDLEQSQLCGDGYPWKPCSRWGMGHMLMFSAGRKGRGCQSTLSTPLWSIAAPPSGQILPGAGRQRLLVWFKWATSLGWEQGQMEDIRHTVCQALLIATPLKDSSHTFLVSVILWESIRLRCQLTQILGELMSNPSLFLREVSCQLELYVKGNTYSLAVPWFRKQNNFLFSRYLPILCDILLYLSTLWESGLRKKTQN